MKYLLSKAAEPLLARLARERTLCAFDFDGTLSAIVEDPARAVMRSRTRTLLQQVASVYPCVVVSGRARVDVLSMLGELKLARVIGNHGAETESSPSRHDCMEEWMRAIEPEIAALKGVRIEDKGMSLAVHYRQSTRKSEARRRIVIAASKLKHARIVGGKQVVNLMPDTSPNKGDAIATERDRLGCNWILYVGDDTNDEDAFSLTGNVVPVRIGRKQRSHARFYLRNQLEIDRLLELLAESR